LWTPFCLLSFPSPEIGLSSYRKLREYRKLHENAYPLSAVTQTEGKHAGQLLPKKKKGKVLMNQKANTVADMAAVLLHHDPTWKAEEKKQDEATRLMEVAKKREARMAELTRQLEELTEKRKDATMSTEEAETVRIGVRTTLGRLRSLQHDAKVADAALQKAAGTNLNILDGTTIRWANILDAEYAATWPKIVVHDSLGKSRYTAAWPLPENTENAEMEEVD
jgi:hypothetical protein